MRIVLPGEYTDLNTYIDAERRNKFIAAQLKKAETHRVAWIIKAKKLAPIEKPVEIHMEWVTKNRKIDPDNVAFAKKFILDGMVIAGLLPNDGRKQIIRFSDSYSVSPSTPRVIVTLTEVEG